MGTLIIPPLTIVPIDRQALAAAAAYASPSWSANAYRAISFVLRANTVGGTVVFTLRGVAAGYSSKDVAGTADATQVSVIEASAVWDITGTWEIRTDGFVRPFAYSGSKAAAAAAMSGVVFGKGSTIDVSSAVTGLDITFSSNVTGTIELWGVPA